MTQNQINYAKAKEEARHNIATENELGRHNVSVESETTRHNVVTEEQAEKQLVINQGVLDESKRHNIASESELSRHNIAVENYNADVLNETARHNSVTENELNRHNVAVETEQSRSNKTSEATKQYEAETRRYASTQATVIGTLVDKLLPGEKVYSSNSSGYASEAANLSPKEKDSAVRKLRTLRKPADNKKKGFVETFVDQMRTNLTNTTSFNTLIN